MKLLSEDGVQVIIREPFQSSLKYGTWMVDKDNEDLMVKGAKCVSVPMDFSWHVVELGESKIFVDGNGIIS